MSTQHVFGSNEFVICERDLMMQETRFVIDIRVPDEGMSEAKADFISRAAENLVRYVQDETNFRN